MLLSSPLKISNHSYKEKMIIQMLELQSRYQKRSLLQMEVSKYKEGHPISPIFDL